MRRTWIGSVVAGSSVVLATRSHAQWQPGAMITSNQIGWGDPAGPMGNLLNSHCDTVYFSTGGVLQVGIQPPAGFSMFFTSGGAVLAFLPAIGNLGVLNATLVDPTTSASGAFGGEVVAMKLNVDFADAGHTLGSLGVPFGDLVLHSIADPPEVNGLTVRQLIAEGNIRLGGGAVSYGIGAAFLLMEQVDGSFLGGVPSAFVQQHLRLKCYADCNLDGQLTVADFGCFQSKFVVGCP